MKIVVITGSTRGLGFGLADSFLELGCAVVVSGRSQGSVDKALGKLTLKHNKERLLGYPCDVSKPEQVQSLWDAAIERFERVDIWINNAGIAHPQLPFWEHPAEQVTTVAETNIIGTMHGSRVAIKGMIAQNFGALYIMAGHGTTGRKLQGLTLYGTTKYGLRYLTDALVQEVRGTNVIVGELRPGMLITELLTDQYMDRPQEWQNASRIFNILADRVETVAPWLAQKILENDRNGAHIVWLTRRKLLWRFLTARITNRKVVDDTLVGVGN